MKKLEVKVIATNESESGTCTGGVCPTIYKSKDGRYFVQGLSVVRNEKDQFNLPQGEEIVEIHDSLLKNLIKKWAN